MALGDIPKTWEQNATFLDIKLRNPGLLQHYVQFMGTRKINTSIYVTFDFTHLYICLHTLQHLHAYICICPSAWCMPFFFLYLLVFFLVAVFFFLLVYVDVPSALNFTSKQASHARPSSPPVIYTRTSS